MGPRGAIPLFCFNNNNNNKFLFQLWAHEGQTEITHIVKLHI